MQQDSNQALNTRLKALLWYLKRPRFYGDLVSQVRGRLFRAAGFFTDTRKDAERWCESRAVDTRTALGQIGGLNIDNDIRELFPAEFSEADRRAAACPVSMGGAADLNLIYWICEYSNAIKVIETGVAYGWSSLSILLSLRSRADGRLISTDMPYPGRGNEEYVGCVVPEDFTALWKIIRLPDRGGLPLALAELNVIDVCHYDSDKSYEGRMWAYPLLWSALRPGGVLISDDIGDNLAFRDFSQSVALDPVVIAFKNKYSGVLVKP
jgi:hypothetical protein